MEWKLKYYFLLCIDIYWKECVKGLFLIIKVINNIGGWYVFGIFNNNFFDFYNVFWKVFVDYWMVVFYMFWVVIDWYDWYKRVIEVIFRFLL